MDLKINNALPNFRARLKIRGNPEFLTHEQKDVLKSSIAKFGTEKDVIIFELPRDTGGVRFHNVRVKTYIDNVLKQYLIKCDINDIYSKIESEIKTIWENYNNTVGGIIKAPNMVKVYHALKKEQFLVKDCHVLKDESSVEDEALEPFEIRKDEKDKEKMKKEEKVIYRPEYQDNNGGVGYPLVSSWRLEWMDNPLPWWL